MNIHLDINEFKSSQKTVVTVGTFDGLHLGHQAIFDELKAVSKTQHLRSVLLTFSPHPAEILKTKPVQLISSLEEKIDVFRSLKIDYMVVIPFSLEFSNLTYVDFVKRYLLEKLNMAHLVFGHDHAFGKNKEGSYLNLQKLGKELNFSLSKVAPFLLNAEIVSSSKIRLAILSGQISLANKLLGHPFSLFGKVVEGDKRGRHLGFPTANIESLLKHKLLPELGVYFVKVLINGSLSYGMCNVGYNPTFNGQDKRVEVHLFNFNKEIYEEEMGIYFLEKLRNEVKFANKEDLINQLVLDKKHCEAIMAKLAVMEDK
jgi:riboflavin kinase/FMN adenylyltransferase